MFAQFAKRAAPIAALAMGTTLSGCGLIFAEAWEDVDGVALAELDTSGEAPSTIRIAGPDQIVITEGDSLAITLEGNAEAGEALRFDRNGDRLSIARDREIYDGNRSAVVLITMPAPSNLEVAGSGSIDSSTLASSGELEIAGSGSIAVTNVAAERIEVEIAGSGNVNATGTTQQLEIEINGSGDVDLRALNADDVEVEINGSGNVELASNGTVDVEINGSGDVSVSGSATCSLQTAGSGTLTCREEVEAVADATASEESAEEDSGAAEE